MRALAAVLLTLAMASPATALDLALPGAEITGQESEAAASARLPEKSWTPGTETPGTEGAIRKTAYRLPSVQMTSLQLIAPLRDQLTEAGYEQIFTCADAECGGFDFRFQLDVLGEPAMHVDLGDFRYLLMRQAGANPHSVAVLASPGLDSGFVHVTEVSDSVLPEPVQVTPTPDTPATPTAASDFIARLIANSHAVLDDLDFGTGSAELTGGPYTSLQELARWLAENPTARVILVGHTDAVGSLEANTALSRRRASAVADRLVNSLGTNRLQLQAAGAGYLAPIASNLTDEGRAANRRVEVVLLSLE